LYVAILQRKSGWAAPPWNAHFGAKLRLFPPFLTGLDKACFSILGWPGFLCEFHRQTGVKNHRHTAGFSLFFGRPNSWFSKSGRAQFGNPLVSPIRVIAYRNPRTLLEK